MIKKIIVSVLMSISAMAAVAAVPFGSQSVLVVENDTGKVLLEKNAGEIVPIASLTKLMTAMVVLDANQDMNELIAIEQGDVDIVKHSTSRVPVGSHISRADVLRLALMSSDNRAAASLARTFDGGPVAFKAAVRAKIAALGMTNTVIEEPTGLSPNNKSTAQDLIKMATAASTYPQIAQITTESSDFININGRNVEYRNTNRLVGAKGWEIGLSKTGYTEEAGKCLIMQIKSAGKNATLVLLNAKASSARIMDALNIRRFISGEEAAPVVAHARPRARARGPVMVASNARIVKVSSTKTRHSKAILRKRR
ncbi:serine hydrolase [Massilia sp. CF038]|uniref:serine hydrolase n=1 Tax=Massilia sp. CF038 TaxID=1881045 RepID=UPI000924A142|nr:serine hydrolase [Massilia sp. CF038]SHG67875.1 D-alanyl-D-alanine carboxypeptidase/D-alanyl-D-alanine endopeptidase (penicillin-binding protein 7) [Massilia sp. CF038]